MSESKVTCLFRFPFFFFFCLPLHSFSCSSSSYLLSSSPSLSSSSPPFLSLFFLFFYPFPSSSLSSFSPLPSFLIPFDFVCVRSHEEDRHLRIGTTADRVEPIENQIHRIAIRANEGSNLVGSTASSSFASHRSCASGYLGCLCENYREKRISKEKRTEGERKVLTFVKIEDNEVDGSFREEELMREHVVFLSSCYSLVNRNSKTKTKKRGKYSSSCSCFCAFSYRSPTSGTEQVRWNH